MIRTTQLTAALAALAIAGCGNGTNYRDRASDARQDAVEQEQRAVQNADQKVDRARATEERQIADASADFEKQRESYRHDVENNLIQIDKDIANLDAKEKTASAADKARLDSNIRQIRADRAAYEQHTKAIDTASSETWADLRAQLDREWDALKALVNGA